MLFCSWRGWSWLLAALSFLPFGAALLFYWQHYQTFIVHIQKVGGPDGIAVLAMLFFGYAASSLLALLAAVCSSIGFVRLNPPKSTSRIWELLGSFALFWAIILHFVLSW